MNISKDEENSNTTESIVTVFDFNSYFVHSTVRDILRTWQIQTSKRNSPDPQA